MDRDGPPPRALPRTEGTAIDIPHPVHKGVCVMRTAFLLGVAPVCRYQDSNNYCAARFKPLEDNYRLYKVVAGKRIQLATQEELTSPAGAWHTLKVTMKGDQIECSLNGKQYLEAKDMTFTK